MSEPTINGKTFEWLAHYLATNYDQRTERMSMESRILDVLCDVRSKTLEEVKNKMSHVTERGCPECYNFTFVYNSLKDYFCHHCGVKLAKVDLNEIHQSRNKP